MKMKNLLLFILLTLSTSALGQFSAGLRGGYGAFGVEFEPPALNTNQERLYEPNFGLVFIYIDKSNAGIQLEVNYATKGWYEKDKTAANTTDFKREVSYLEIPIMSHVELGRGWFRIIGVLGPYIAFKQSETTTHNNYQSIINGNSYKKYTQPIRKLDFGNKIGIGFRVNAGTRFSAIADIRYDLQIAGGQNIFKNHPNKIQISRYSELSLSFGLLYNIFIQKEEKPKEYYVPKEGINEIF